MRAQATYHGDSSSILRSNKEYALNLFSSSVVAALSPLTTMADMAPHLFKRQTPHAKCQQCAFSSPRGGWVGARAHTTIHARGTKKTKTERPTMFASGLGCRYGAVTSLAPCAHNDHSNVDPPTRTRIVP